MVMKKFLIGLFILGLCAAAYGAGESRVELTDNSVIKGEVTALADGVYTIKSETLGEIKIPAEKILRIEPAEATSALPSQTQMDAYKAKIMNNPEVVGMISHLAAEPQIKEIVADPQIQSSAKSGDIQDVLKSKKFTDFVNNPEVQKIIDKLKSQSIEKP